MARTPGRRGLAAARRAAGAGRTGGRANCRAGGAEGGSRTCCRRACACACGCTGTRHAAAHREAQAGAPPAAAGRTGRGRARRCRPGARGATAPATAAAPEAKRAEAADALAERSRDSARERSSEAVESRRSQAVAKAAAPAFSPAPAGALQADAPVAAIAQLRLAIGAEPTLWYWQRPAGPSRPFDNAISQWLGRAEAATRGRWQARPSLPAEAAPTELLLLRNGELSQRLRIADDALLWQRLDRGDVLRAPLDAATLAALRQALDAATP